MLCHLTRLIGDNVGLGKHLSNVDEFLTCDEEIEISSYVFWRPLERQLISELCTFYAYNEMGTTNQPRPFKPWCGTELGQLNLYGDPK